MPPTAPICDFGRPAPDFRLSTPGGDVHTKTGLMGENGLLVAFICNHCPYVKTLINRLSADIRILQSQGVGTALIMSNDYNKYPADSPENMTRFAAAHDLTAPYLVDEDQTVARAYGAVCTPDFFGFDATGGLQYRGRLDDIGMHGDPSNRVPELLNAMHKMIETGKGPEQQTPSMGCSIKWS